MNSKLLYFLIAYCFLFGFIGKLITFPVGILVEVLIFITLIATIFINKAKDWNNFKIDLFYLNFVWFIISLLEFFNPGASTIGWLVELRSTAFYPVIIVLLGLVIFKTNRDLDIFLIVVIALSTLASLNGIKQMYFGLFDGEKAFLAANESTHLLWGRLRVFSFWDAGQFGASQAYVGAMALILTFLPMKFWKKLILASCALLNLYGMLISGTRGALFGIVVAVFVAILLSKSVKTIVFGGVVAVAFLIILKFTHIGDGNYQIYRLRTAVNPVEDASFNARIINQQKLRNYMADLPFGGGLGVVGYNGYQYNQDKILHTIPPDSYFVKVWVMYGIVGLTIWFCIMMYITGKGFGIAWRINDKALKIKIVALNAGFAGVLFCSYGNEVINIMPTSIIVYLSWVFIFISPKLENSQRSKLLM